jgi:hypothetical protein
MERNDGACRRLLDTVIGCKEMRGTSITRVGLSICAVLGFAVFRAAGQEENPKEIQAKGMPPRVAATEYQAQAQAGSVMIGAEFMGHSVPTPEHTFATEDYIVIEAGLFGPAGAHATLSRDDFSVRISGKKAALGSEPYELVLKTLKDPEWQPPESEESKDKGSKGGLTTGGGGGGGDKLPPVPPKMPFPLRRAMEQQVQKSAMEIGDRALPQAGLLFFRFAGKTDSIKSLELIYSGAAGKATLTLQP